MRNDWQIKQVGEDRLDELLELFQWVWAEGHAPAEIDKLRKDIDWDRFWVVELSCDTPSAEQAKRIIGVAGSFKLELPVPGGTLPTGGLSFVGVHPQFRRRGILRALLTKHFENCLGRGEWASMLTASEIPIYTRFGYGQVNRILRVTLPRDVALWDVPEQEQVEIELAHMDVALHSELTERIYQDARQQTTRPAWIPAGQAGAWDGHFIDPPELLKGAETLRLAIARRNGIPSGFATFRRKKHWDDDNVPKGNVIVHQVVSADPASNRMLWKTLTSMDLTSTISADVLSLDDPLFCLLRNPREVVTNVRDFLHLRLLDLPKALMARTYACDLELTLQVDDKVLPANDGCWKLAVRDGLARVERSDSALDLSLDIRILASVFLGGFSPVSFADAGLIQEHTTGAAQKLAQALWVSRQPGTVFGF